MTKWARLRRKHKQKVKEMFKDVKWCENPACGSGIFVAPAHRHNIRYYRANPDLFSDYNQVIMLCERCHREIESNNEKTEELFVKIRGSEHKRLC